MLEHLSPLNDVKNETNMGPQCPLVVALSIYSLIPAHHSQARLTQMQVPAALGNYVKMLKAYSNTTASASFFQNFKLGVSHLQSQYSRG